MKTPYVNELEPNRVITTSFLVHSKEIRQKKSGELYLSLLLGDRTGDLDAKMWDNVNEVVDDFDRDDFVKVKGLIQVFHNRPQLTIHKVRRMDDSEIEFGDYFPSSRRDPDEMWTELRGIVAGMTNPHLKGLLEALLDDEDVSRLYRRAPAAKQIHHAYLGGLIEHVLSLCALARMTAGHYPNVDLDLLLTGVVLHDIGKIYELNYERGFSYSNDGQLLGHINIGLRMVADKVRGLPGFPPPLRSLVDHMILSHHGQLEFGSPKLPQFPEALLLHFLDDLDSKMECMRALIENDRQVEGCFTTYNAALTRAALKKDRYLSGAPEPQRVRPATGAVRPEAPVNGEARPKGEARPDGAKPNGDVRPNPEARPNGAAPGAASQLPAAPTPPVARPEVATQHPLFGPKSDSPFADKLKLALQPGVPKQEN
jgi:3'-5' exoribonuclease